MFNFDINAHFLSGEVMNLGGISIPYDKYVFNEIIVTAVIGTDKYTAYAEKLAELLPSSMKARYMARTEKERINSIIGALLAASELGLEELKKITLGKNGKPLYERSFSISHCGNVCVFACAENGKKSGKAIGVDVQKYIPYNLKLLDYIANENEKAQVGNFGSADNASEKVENFVSAESASDKFKIVGSTESASKKDLPLTALWTKKESVIKMSGGTVCGGLKKIDTQDLSCRSIYTSEFLKGYCLSLFIEK